MFQRITLIGRVGQDPQMRYTSDGTPVTSFSLATTTKVNKSQPGGGERPCPQGWKESYNGRSWELTTWWRITCWRGLAETVNQYLSKGREVFVEGEMAGEAADGKLNPRIWQGNDGASRANFELTARSIQFLGGRGESEGSGGAPIGEPPPEGYEEDALPF